MARYFGYVLLLTCLALLGFSLGDLIFRCPSCTAERVSACPEVKATCGEIVRESGCGCCPVCAKLEGEHCGVYTPRCSTGLKCSPSAEAEFPLQQLIQGLGHCVQMVDPTASEQPVTNDVHGTQIPPEKRPTKDHRQWPKVSARLQHQNELRTRMKINPAEESRVQRQPQCFQSLCEQDLDQVLEEISKMTFQDNSGLLDNLYELKFPNCDRYGLYNLKQCNISTHGQRGECWCVNRLTGVQLPTSPSVRGDPNCNQFQEDVMPLPTAVALC